MKTIQTFSSTVVSCNLQEHGLDLARASMIILQMINDISIITSYYLGLMQWYTSSRTVCTLNVTFNLSISNTNYFTLHCEGK